MIIQKTGMLKYLRYLGIFCAITMGFMTIVATGEDDAEDLAADIVDIDFDENADLELDSVTIEKSDAEVQIAATEQTCDTTSVNQAIADANIEGIDNVTIKTVKLLYVQARYRNATWAPSSSTSLTCTASISGGGPDATFTATAINAANSDWVNLTLPTAAQDAINYYLTNRGEAFTYCVVCDDGDEITEYSVEYDLNIGVNIEGNI